MRLNADLIQKSG
jgi:U2 small nuclear ribonucleoprotein A'